MKKLLTLVAASLLSTAVLAQGHLAVVNVAQILQGSARVKAINTKIRKEYQPQQMKLAAQDKAIQADMKKLKRNASVMSAEQKTKLQTTIKNDREDFAKNAAIFQRKLAAARNSAMKDVVDSLNGIIKTVADHDGYDVVLFSQAVAYSGKTPDITTDVAKAFNAAK